jgi:UDP-N-acetylglucosamine--N-acetylmuramyl-(pentapeptide) pyrophosphoryl-undecaprenol N-acetylglucosamine transferase
MKVLLTGGGTGGHVYPALAIAEAIRRRDPASGILYMGSAAGMEAKLVPAAGIPFVGLAVRPPRSQAPGRVLLALATGAASVGQATAVIARFRPGTIVATGGIAAAPAVLAGGALRVPIVVLEGNAIPGRVNRVLARFARAVAVTSEHAAARFPGRRAVVTGLPVRREVYTMARDDGLRAFGLDTRRRTVLVLGGSQGAARLNAAVEDAIALLGHRRDLQILHQVGRGWGMTPGATGAPTPGSTGKQERPPDVRLPAAGAETQAETREVGGVHYVRVPYIDRIGLAYASADLVISRSGATALAEITACGLPAILVPYRYAAEDHQAHNASPLVQAGAAVLVPDRDLSGEILAREIASLFDAPGRLVAMAACARSLGHPDAADRVLALLVGLCRRPQAQEVRG